MSVGVPRALRVTERNVIAYTRNWIVIAAGFVEPLFYLASIGVGIGALVGEVTGPGGAVVEFEEFVAPGMLAAAAMNGAIADSTFNIFHKLRWMKTYDVMLATPVRVLDITLGELTWAVTRGTTQPKWKPGDPIKEIPRRFYPSPEEQAQYQASDVTLVDPLYQLQIQTAGDRGAGTFTTPIVNIPGQGYTGVNPPDTCGDVGPNHYIQMVNTGGGSDVAIYDKAEPTPNLITTLRLDALGGGQCANGFGDPIVLYDRFAQRWMLSEFSSSGNNLCVYISQTEDPVSGGWFNYAFTAPSFPDYPKYGVWPTDANGGLGSYVVTANDGGPGIYALDRGAMLSGSPGTYQRVTIPGLSGFGFEAPTPADLDGPLPPATGSPAIIMRHRDTENHSGLTAPGDLLEMWNFDIDWVTPANSNLVNETPIDVSEFDSNLCGLTSFFCFPQPSGTTLDPLREVIMSRLQYLNFGTHETLVGNLVTDVDGTDHGGVRWFELRRTGGPWSLFQEGTYAIDDDHRWMAASAMDQSGNIALAYSVSSTSTFPSLRYTGRLADDPLNVMTQPESVIHAGTAVNSSNRWGDYAAMNLDPVDDCTFWFTSLDNSSSNWRTQIASMRFDACGCEVEPPALSISGVVGGDNRIDIGWVDSTNPTIQTYRVRRAPAPGGPYVTIAEVPDSSPAASTGAGYSFSDTAVSGGSTYYYIVLANDGAACTSPSSNEAGVTATGLCTLSPQFDGLQSVTTPFDATCELQLGWNAGTPRCDGPLTYDVYRSTDPEFEPAVGNLLVPGLSGTSYSDFDTLDSGQRYYYIVRATDQSNAIGESNDVEVSGIPLGPLTNGTWIDDAGDTGDPKMVLSGLWSIDSSEGNLGPKVYKTGTYSNLLCVAMTTPTLQLGASSSLSFASQYEIENSWDKGEVQISTDGGFSWSRLDVGYPGNSTNASDNCGLPTGSYFTGTDLSYSNYNVDLSSFAGQLVKVRFLLSTDSSVTRDGWWIDDIQITDVDVPGDCVAGSSCEDNPLVSVEPEGPQTFCEGTEVPLSANLTGGVGPFDYQWMRDGVDIPGANASTYVADDVGLHTFNVKVRAASCGDDAFDASASLLEWRSKPTFGGLQSAESGLDPTCGVTLDWSAASTVCDGPISYSIYRDTTSPVAVTPANLIRSGLTETTFTDTGNLVDGTFYIYVVRAFDLSTGQDDGNTIEAGDVAVDPTAGLSVPFFDDFETPADFADWTVITDPLHNCGDWALAGTSAQLPSGGQGTYALSDNAACPDGSVTSNTLESPSVDTDLPGLSSMILGYDLYYNYNLSDEASVQVWDGAAWQTLWNSTTADINQHFEWDVTAFAAGNSDFKVRFNYQLAKQDQWLSVDNVFLLADVDLACSTSNVPAPVPDGSAFSAPLRGDRLTEGGDSIRATWDVDSCRSADYNLLYGDLADVASVTLAGSECSLGVSGSYDWTAVPPGDLFFLIVGANGDGLESSWGVDSADAERNGPVASGECSVTVKDSSDVCP